MSPSQTPSRGKGNTLHRAAVITPHDVTYGNGTAVPADSGLGRDLPAILDGTLGRFDRASTIVLDGPLTIGAHVRQKDAALACGWNCGQQGAWTTYHRTDGTTVAVGIKAAMNPALHFGVLFDYETDPGVTATRLDRYHRATGGAWKGTCATSALNTLRSSWGNERYQPLWRIPKMPVRSDVGPMVWRRYLTTDEQAWGYVHVFDANSAYLGAAGNAELAWSQLHRSGPCPFDPDTPGYWLINLSPHIWERTHAGDWPPLFNRRGGTEVWVTTPYARLLRDMGDPCDVTDSYTACAETRAEGGGRLHPAGSRITRRIAEQIRDALRPGIADEHVRRAIKRTYTDLVGAMQREGMRVYRPDWAETIIDGWRATLYRNMIRVRAEIGYWPVRVATDSLAYPDSNPDPTTLGAHVGTHPKGLWGLGFYRHTATYTAAEWQTRNERQARRG